jgi:hypothetical protein
MENTYYVTFCDNSGGFLLKLPAYLCFTIGSIITWHHQDYLVISINHIDKQIIATEINLIEKS